MAKVLIPTKPQKITVTDMSGKSIGYIETPLISATAIKYCQNCVELEDHECTHVNTINNLEKNVKELTEQMHSTRRDCEFQVSLWRQKYIELFTMLARANRCQMCLNRPDDAVTLQCGHLICGDCIQKYLNTFDYLLDPDISQVACPLPHPNSQPSDADDTKLKYFCDHEGGALEIEKSRRHASLSVKAIEAVLKHEVHEEQWGDEDIWHLIERPNLYKYYE